MATDETTIGDFVFAEIVEQKDEEAKQEETRPEQDERKKEDKS